jgi:hypothetical protein
MTYFSRTSEVITLDEMWKAVSQMEEGSRQHLIKDICCLKLKGEKERVILVEGEEV